VISVVELCAFDLMNGDEILDDMLVTLVNFPCL
jgi:hypothetical protein